jgi:uncharacterized membrane protein YiaA
MWLNEGYYLPVCSLDCSVVSVQKIIDRLEGIPVTDIYYGIAWFTTSSFYFIVLIIGLWNADLELQVKRGFYSMSLF